MFLNVSVALSLAAFLAIGSPEAPPYCDSELLRLPKSPTSYQIRGDRCEGIYAQQVSTVSVDLRSFVKGFGEFDPEKQSELELAWTPPPGIVRDARLRAFSLRSRVYYRMDTALSASAARYRWPTEILALQQLKGPDLGVLAWIDLPGPGGTARPVYLPLRAAAAASADSYEVTLVPSKKLKQLLLTILRIDERGTPEKVPVVDHRDVGGEFAYYASNEPTVFSTGKLGASGYYRLVINAMAASGEAVGKEIDFYHSEN